MDHRSLLAVLCLGFAVTGMSYGQVISSFEVDTEGWIVWDANCSNYSQTLATHTPTWQPAGGDAGGWVQHHDSTNYCSFFAAPAPYLGDRSAYVSGILEFSLSSTESDWQNSDVVVLIGAGRVICYELPLMPPSPPAWRHYVVPLQAGEFTYNNESGATVSAADFAAVLADLDGLLLPAEFGAQIEETVGLDSVWLRQPDTPVDDAPPMVVRLLGACPNPFNPRTTVSFTLPEASHAVVAIYDAKGQVVARLVNESLPAGAHAVDWDGRDARGVYAVGDVFLSPDDVMGC